MSNMDNLLKYLQKESLRLEYIQIDLLDSIPISKTEDFRMLFDESQKANYFAQGFKHCIGLIEEFFLKNEFPNEVQNLELYLDQKGSIIRGSDEEDYILNDKVGLFPTLPREETLPIITQMLQDMEKGDLKWFCLTPGIGMCYGIAECNKKAVYRGTEFGNYTNTIYDLNGEGKFHLRFKNMNGWIDNDLGNKLLITIKDKDRIK